MHLGEKVITGEMDGCPIWRFRTAGEVLAHVLEKMQAKKQIKEDLDVEEAIERWKESTN